MVPMPMYIGPPVVGVERLLPRLGPRQSADSRRGARAGDPSGRSGRSGARSASVGRSRRTRNAGEPAAHSKLSTTTRRSSRARQQPRRARRPAARAGGRAGSRGAAVIGVGQAVLGDVHGSPVAPAIPSAGGSPSGRSPSRSRCSWWGRERRRGSGVFQAEGGHEVEQRNRAGRGGQPSSPRK